MLRLVRPRRRIDTLQSSGRGRNEIETEVLASRLQLVPAGVLPIGSTALGHGHVDNAHPSFADQAERKPADDALVVRVRGKDQRARRISRQQRTLWRRKSTQRIVLALPEQSIELSDKVVIRVHSLPRNLREACRRNRLAVAFVVLVRYVERNLPSELRKLGLEHAAGAIDDVVTAGP